MKKIWTITRDQFNFKNFTTKDISLISSWLGIALVAAIIESFTMGVIAGFFELTLTPIVILVFCSFNKMSRNLILVLLLALIYPFVAYNITAHSVFVKPISWLTDFILVFLAAVPLGLISNVKTPKKKIFLGLIGVTMFFIVKWIMHGISGALIWFDNLESDEAKFQAAMLFNMPYILINYAITFILYPIVMNGLYKANLIQDTNNNW